MDLKEKLLVLAKENKAKFLEVLAYYLAYEGIRHSKEARELAKLFGIDPERLLEDIIKHKMRLKEIDFKDFVLGSISLASYIISRRSGHGKGRNV